MFSTVSELPVIEQNFTEDENVKQTAAQKHFHQEVSKS